MNSTGGVDPERAHTAAQFVGMMKHLKDESGLTYRQLEERAERTGRVLPRSTIADVLRRQALPRPRILNAFVHACGAGEHADAWLRARNRLAGADASANGATAEDSALDGGDGVLPAHDATGCSSECNGDRGSAVEEIHGTPGRSGTSSDSARERPGLRHRAVAPAVVTSLAAVLLAGIVSWAVVPNDPVGTVPSASQPAAGWYSIRPSRDSALCMTEGRDPQGGGGGPVAVQRPCGQSTPPYTRIDPLGGGRFFIKWVHPEHGWGCLTVLSSGLLEPWDDCRSSRSTQVFTFERLETAGTRASGPAHATAYRVRTADGRCLGISGAPAGAAPAAAVVGPCADAADQRLLLVQEPVPAASALPSAG
ncbi:helix-turn-helix domain-containing protein [Streptomyces sp. NPDC127084]|uniref:helix-turn-helix domain-containing protein n=1 Tax=Streptomyces sp. NPDC127084 TaxID=3347133 RepID=UPI00364EF7FC